MGDEGTGGLGEFLIQTPQLLLSVAVGKRLCKEQYPKSPNSHLPSPSYSCQSGITHCGGADIFLRRASSAISCILSKEVSLINLEADST
jgi:hypothetical protein